METGAHTSVCHLGAREMKSPHIVIITVCPGLRLNKVLYNERVQVDMYCVPVTGKDSFVTPLVYSYAYLQSLACST